MPKKQHLKDIWTVVFKDQVKTNAPYLQRLKKRGKRGGITTKSRNIRRIPLPTVAITNTRSLTNKIDELNSVVKYNPLKSKHNPD